MSISGVPQANSLTNSPLWPNSQNGQPRAYAPSAFDTFQRSMAEPALHVSQKDRLKAMIFHPLLSLNAGPKLKAIPQARESRAARLKMYLEVRGALNREGKGHLDNLLKTGVLNDTDTDDQHSTLYQLYAILKTPRAQGLSNKATLQETIKILNKPYLITQKFGPISENVGREILRVRNNPQATLNRAGSLPADKPLTWADLNVDTSATCVSSSVMYYMADKKPGELARHLNELTSPMQAFYEKVKPSELSPDDPAQATSILQQNNIKYVQSGDDELLVKVELPKAGLLRAINDSGKNGDGNYRTGVEAAYQSALTFLSTRSYDPATDFRDSEVPGVGSKGLTEPEKTLMETIIKDNGGVGSVTYQVVAGKNNPGPGEESQSYLYGYTRSFEQITSDMVQALNMGEFVVIGITDTDETGAIVGGHEITLTSAFVDPKDNELKFVVVDSDDDIAKPVVRTAREVIPRIHHAGLPLQLAQGINSEMSASTTYLKPDQNDLANFEPMAFLNDTLPAGALPQQQQVAETPVEIPVETPLHPQQPVQPAVAAQPVQQPVQQAQPTVSWEPVYGYGYNHGYAPAAAYYPQQAYYYPQQQYAVNAPIAGYGSLQQYAY